MKLTKQITIYSGIILLANLILGFLINIIFKIDGNLYRIIIEPIFFLIITFFLVRKWRYFGVISSIICYVVPFIIVIIGLFIDYGVVETYKRLTEPSDMPIKWNVFYGFYNMFVKFRIYSIYGLIIGGLVGLFSVSWKRFKKASVVED